MVHAAGENEDGGWSQPPTHDHTVFVLRNLEAGRGATFALPDTLVHVRRDAAYVVSVRRRGLWVLLGALVDADEAANVVVEWAELAPQCYVRILGPR